MVMSWGAEYLYRGRFFVGWKNFGKERFQEFFLFFFFLILILNSKLCKLFFVELFVNFLEIYWPNESRSKNYR